VNRRRAPIVDLRCGGFHDSCLFGLNVQLDRRNFDL
jgi:hypothetical protein